MNVIAADMCTNARRVRKRWLPKIQSLLPDSLPASSCTAHPRKAKRGVSGGGGGQGGDAPVQASSSLLEQFNTSYLEAPPYELHQREVAGEREVVGEREKEVSPLLPHLQFASSRGIVGGAGGCGGQVEEVLMAGEADGEARLQNEQSPHLPLSSSPQPAEPTPPAHLLKTDRKGMEPVEDSQQ